MRQLFTSRLSPKTIQYIYLPPAGIELEQLLSMPPRQLRRIKLLFGHFHYGIDKTLAKPGKYLTCLRETGARLVSNYHEHIRGGFAGDLSLLDYFNIQKPKDMDNYAVRLLSGIGESIPFGHVTEAHLSLAQTNLVTRFAAFGLYEHMAESLERFQSVLGFAPAGIGHENVTSPEQKSARPVLPEEITSLVQRNVWDKKLYAFAQEKFLA